MLDLWIPESRPPQVSEEARSDVLKLVANDGAAATGFREFSRIEEEAPLAEYLERFGFDMRQEEGRVMPSRMFKIGASLTFLAYRKSGYFQSIDEESCAMAEMMAEIDGVPKAYLLSLNADVGLHQLMDEVTRTEHIDVRHKDSMGQPLHIGAGCVRYYMQTALAA